MVKLARKCLRLTLLLGLFLCFFWGGSTVTASELPPGVIVGDDKGLRAGKDGKYFVEHNDIRPGIEFKKKITISNYSQEKDPFTLRMDMKADKVSGEINLLEAITVVLKLEGKVIYSGDLAGKADDPKYKLPLELGVYAVGDSHVLDAEFKVRSDLPEEQWKKPNEADFYWVFYATKESEPGPPEPPGPKPKPGPDPKPGPSGPKGLLPKTGEEWSFVLIGITVGLLLTMTVVIMSRRKQQD